MKLVFRVTLAIFLFLTISSTAIGYFAITKYQSSQINLVDESLNSKIRALVATKEDPLTVAQYLAQTSSIPVTVEYLTDTGMVTVLTVSGPDIPTTPSASTLLQASHADVNYGADLRIRVFAMPDGKKLILAASLASIDADVSALTRNLILFIVFVDLLAGLIAFLVFRRDGKINQVSQLMAQQHLAMQKFLGDASHELRTPLTVIKGYVDLARSTSDQKRQVGYLDKSAKEILHMESIIKDLLFIAEVGESESVAVQDVAVRGILRDHIEVLQALQPERKIVTNLESEFIIQADSKLIDRMIGNLFSNIRRHTPADAPISASLAQDQKQVVITIEDGGPGFGEYPDNSRAFKRFSAQRSKEGGGTGLGLSIIDGVAERYHGSVEYSRSELGGLKVVITLPRSTS